MTLKTIGKAVKDAMHAQNNPEGQISLINIQILVPQEHKIFAVLDLFHPLKRLEINQIPLKTALKSTKHS